MSKRSSSIIKAGLVAGTLDICAAIISVYARSGKGPEVIFRYISRGAFGDDARTGGMAYVVAGLLFHYIIAFAFTILFFMLYPKIRQWASKYIIATGLVYGAVVWCIMNLIIVPSSRITPAPPTVDSVIREMLILMCCIGLPIAIIAKKHYHERDHSTIRSHHL